MQQSTALYPALIYKNKKSNIYVANCIIKKLVGYGHTEIDAIKNLEKILNKPELNYEIKIKPVYQFLDNLSFSKIK